MARRFIIWIWGKLERKLDWAFGMQAKKMAKRGEDGRQGRRSYPHISLVVFFYIYSFISFSLFFSHFIWRFLFLFLFAGCRITSYLNLVQPEHTLLPLAFIKRITVLYDKYSNSVAVQLTQFCAQPNGPNVFFIFFFCFFHLYFFSHRGGANLYRCELSFRKCLTFYDVWPDECVWSAMVCCSGWVWSVWSCNY